MAVQLCSSNRGDLPGNGLGLVWKIDLIGPGGLQKLLDIKYTPTSSLVFLTSEIGVSKSVPVHHPSVSSSDIKAASSRRSPVSCAQGIASCDEDRRAGASREAPSIEGKRKITLRPEGNLPAQNGKPAATSKAV